MTNGLYEAKRPMTVLAGRYGHPMLVIGAAARCRLTGRTPPDRRCHLVPGQATRLRLRTGDCHAAPARRGLEPRQDIVRVLPPSANVS